MSGEYVDRLRKRALSFLSEAERVSDPNLAIFLAEQSLQLYVKSVYYELFGSMLRGHKIRELLAILIKSLESHGYKAYADEILRFVDEHRRTLIELETAYTMARYGEIDYSVNDVKQAIDVVRKLIEILDQVCRGVKLG
ncbi:HEPN domain protein [Ignisphaera aggregans DSM 17230]|uniref:HEPN domain protein n=1 Tax=Ignisphaera aggregans (strain DSM 17230 / JCM 13409 / AQ1.S1) TaxID=583356 RepID=E0SS08_IGNAA|nr:HEPN domain protein [Ignisphaera aggregans DSM 17230]